MSFLEKILDTEKNIVKKIIKNNTYLKILAFCIAIIMFIIFNGSGVKEIDQYFQKTEYIDGIKLNVIAGENKIITGLPESIGVNVSGQPNEINAFKHNKDSVVAQINLSSYKNDGDYPIENSMIKLNNTYGTNVSPIIQDYKISVDSKTQVSVPVEVSYINQDQNSAILLGTPIISQPNVTFDIGMESKKDIGIVRVILDLKKLDDTKSGEYTYQEQIKVYNKTGSLMDTHTDLPTIEIKQPYQIRTVTLPIKYTDVNNKTGEYISKICKNKITDNNCNDEVEVYGSEAEINKLTNITYNVDLSDYNKNNPIVEATPVLPENVFVKGDDTINVEIKMEKGYTKEFKSVPIIVQNLNSSLKVPSLANATVDLTVTGAEEKTKNLTTNDLMIYVNVGDITTPQKVTLPIETNIDPTIDYTISKSQIELTIEEKNNKE